MALFRGMVGYLCLGSPAPRLLLISLRYTQLALQYREPLGCLSWGSLRPCKMPVVALAETCWWKCCSFSEQNKDDTGPVETHGLSELSPPLPPLLCAVACGAGRTCNALQLGIPPSSWLCLRWAEDSSTHYFWVSVLSIGLPA